MLKIAMDTAGDLAPGWEQEYQIDLIPINIIHGEKSYLQGIDLKYEDFYKLVDTSGTIPSTSQPTPTNLSSSTAALPRKAIRFFPSMSLRNYP